MIFTDIITHSFETNGRRATLRERKEMRKTCGPYHWKPTEAPSGGRGFYQSSKGLRCGDSTFDLRLEYANDHLSGRLAHITGYYIDGFQDETIVPIVARLPHGRGFLAGWTMGASMCASIETDIYETIEDAARRAHDHTAYVAEEMRDSREEEENEEMEA